MTNKLLLLMLCFNILFSVANGMGVRKQTYNTEYRNEDALLMWRLNTLTYCSQETLSVNTRTISLILRQ